MLKQIWGLCCICHVIRIHFFIHSWVYIKYTYITFFKLITKQYFLVVVAVTDKLTLKDLGICGIWVFI